MRSDRMLGYEFGEDSSPSRMTGHAGLCRIFREAECYGLGRAARKEMEKRFRKGRRRTFPSPTRLYEYLDEFHNEGEEAKRVEGKAFIPVRNQRLEGRARFECAVHPETRTQMMADWANLVYELAGPCRLRQIAAYSSFCIPNTHPDDPIWKERDQGHVRSDFYHKLQWNERQALQRHALEAGCDLIIDPTFPFSPKGQRARKSRLGTLLEFLREAGKDTNTDIRIALAPGKIVLGQNTTLVGNWFFSQSMSPKPGRGYKNTVFTWYAPRVLHEVDQFDKSFRHWHKAYGVSLAEAAERIQGIIDTIQV